MTGQDGGRTRYRVTVVVDMDAEDRAQARQYAEAGAWTYDANSCVIGSFAELATDIATDEKP